ncbi:DUF692 domain-containing protein [Aliiglaciecola sp. 3_MG-2023]|uniref:MNIO family bufferin maturase n=1 Tax=Aliiglaciecola sp. 3_MG-2023 TaxID=3062644 RepID=UPI0026E288F4|nr:DUF692 domain-containing protein [Aliiglaciecola sp. 3_MG-2023]MDO6691989.1 DUF692 domain-containing protein [Aliiglaciecola sp. 3_MG-2023]
MQNLTKLPADAGICLKPEHFDSIPNTVEGQLWFEVHAENYLIQGGPRLERLQHIAQNFPLSIHGVGASVGGPTPINSEHLKRLSRLVNLVPTAAFSEHIAWSGTAGNYLGNLMPTPITTESLKSTARNIEQLQDALQRPILVENPANYLNFKSEMSESEFMMSLVSMTGCGILLDVNNLFISANNTGINAHGYIKNLDPSSIGEIHVAGHSVDPIEKDLLIDSHDSEVSKAVWSLLSEALNHIGPCPVLIERDANLPAFNVLLAERNFARKLINQNKQVA